MSSLNLAGLKILVSQDCLAFDLGYDHFFFISISYDAFDCLRFDLEVVGVLLFHLGYLDDIDSF